MSIRPQQLGATLASVISCLQFPASSSLPPVLFFQFSSSTSLLPALFLQFLGISLLGLGRGPQNRTSHLGFSPGMSVGKSVRQCLAGFASSPCSPVMASPKAKASDPQRSARGPSTSPRGLRVVVHFCGGGSGGPSKACSTWVGSRVEPSFWRSSKAGHSARSPKPTCTGSRLALKNHDSGRCLSLIGRNASECNRLNHQLASTLRLSWIGIQRHCEFIGQW